MAKPTITIRDSGNFKIAAFEIPGGVTTPAEFAEAVNEAPSLAGDKPVLVTGRGPIWAYGMLVHVAHPSPAVGTFDPRLGYVVVQTHNAEYALGQVIPDPEAKTAPTPVAA